MLRFIIRRGSFSIFSLLIISFLMFFITSHVEPFMMGQRLEQYVPPEERGDMHDTIEVFVEFEDKNWLSRYSTWLSLALRGRFGRSFLYQMPAVEVLKRGISNTLTLTITAFVISWGIAIPLGFYTAIHNKKIRSSFFTVLGMIGISTPEFFISLLVIYFAYLTNLFPIGGVIDANVLIEGKWFESLLSYIHHLILPSLILASMNLARTFKIIKGEMLDQLKMEYIEYAEAKGLPKKYILYHHAFRNCMNPLATNLGMQVGTLLTGSLFVEFIFSIDGIGTTTIRSLNSLDQPVAMASLFASALLLITGNLFADIFLAYLDPKIKMQFFND